MSLKQTDKKKILTRKIMTLDKKKTSSQGKTRVMRLSYI